MVCLRRFHSECSHPLPAFCMVYEVEATFSQSAGLEPRKTLNWGSLFCVVPSTLSNIQEWVHPVKDVSLMSRIAWNPKLGQLIPTVSPFPLPLTRRSLSKYIDKPVKLRCNTNECDTSWFKTTIYDENSIVYTYNNSPLKGNIQNCTCKSYLEALFLAHINNPLKGNFQNHTCKPYLEALFLVAALSKAIF